jgi:hypothetical protein
MSECPICQHAKVRIINAALQGGRLPSVVAHQFRLDRRSLDAHMAHEPVLIQAPQGIWLSHPGTVIDSNACEDEGLRVSDELSDECLCYWCKMSGYQRLLRAWEEANRSEKERFCVDTRTMDVPF